MDESGLGRIVVGKPNSTATGHLLRVAFLHSISTILPPPGLVLDWITAMPQSGEDSRGSRHVLLARQLWSVSQDAGLDPKITSSILTSLFSALGSENVLSFLSGIWCSSSPPRQRENALLYGRAYLQAHVSGDTDKVAVDFQTIVPSLLVALQDTEKGARQEAIGCVKVIREITETKFSSGSPVYGFDVVYGSTDRESFCRFFCLLLLT